MEKRDLSTRVARWLLLLQEYKYAIKHRSGSMMRHVDALSRNVVRVIDIDTPLIGIKRAQANDDRLKPIKEILKQEDRYDDYYLKSDILYKEIGNTEKLVIPKNMQNDIIKQAHEKGHFGVNKTKALIDNDYFIPKLDDKIKSLIENCIPCLLINRKRGKQEGELHPLPKPDVPLHTYHADFMGPMTTTGKNYKHLLVIVDAFTKFCWIYPTKTTSAACLISKLEFQNIIFGNPFVIVTDRGSAFTSDDFKKYCEENAIHHAKVTTGLPRANGQVERLNAVVATVLAKVSMDNPPGWYKYVDTVQRYINSSVSRSTKFTPFELITGVKMRNKGDCEIKRIVEEEMILNFNAERDQLRQIAKTQIIKMQEENKKNYNLRRKPASTYNVDDMIAIKRTQFGGGLKLKPKYLGPYQITKVKSNGTYDVVKIGNSEGPAKSVTCSEYIKPCQTNNSRRIRAGWPIV